MARFFEVVLGAFIAFGLAASCAKKTPEQKYQEAEQAFQKGDPLGAIVLAHEILRDNTTGPLALQARQLLFSCHWRGRDIKACRLVLNDIITQMGLNNPSGQTAAHLKIQTYEIVRQTTEALAQTQSFLQAVTTGTAFWADLMLKQGDLLRATDQATTAQRVYARVFLSGNLTEQQRFESLDRLAISYATTQSAAAGVKFFEQYLADKPSTQTVPPIYMIIGHLESVLKHDEQEKTRYQKAFEEFGQSYERASGADEKIGILVQYSRAREFAGEVDQAAALLRKGLQEFPTSSRRINLYYNLAVLYASHQRYDEAIAICRDIPSQFPNDPARVRSYFIAAECHRQQKKFESAVADYREIMALFPGQRPGQEAMMEIRRTEEMRRKDAETSATKAAALLTSPTLTATTGTATTSPSAAIKRPAPSVPSGAAKVSASTTPLPRATVPQTTGSARPKPPTP
jgi:tetratricopeptide (TPR) repeat protein